MSVPIDGRLERLAAISRPPYPAPGPSTGRPPRPGDGPSRLLKATADLASWRLCGADGPQRLALRRLVWCVLCAAVVGCGDSERGADPASGPGSSPPASASPMPASTQPVAIDVSAVPSTVPSVALRIGDAERAALEAAPWSAADVPGAFIDDDGTTYDPVDLNYRGAFALLNLINSDGDQRNWKVKFAKEAAYLGRREWNFNLEPHLRQKLAYDLMLLGGVAVPNATHVVLDVNGERQGLYLQYADPDNKAFLKDVFGSAAGDLYKAAFDIPNEPKKFALLTYLGPDDADYFLHYDKKLNDEGAAETDYSALRAFIAALNDTPDDAFPGWLRQHFDVEGFTNYLVVSNFIANWDSYPQRPKNYWLYQSPISERWVFIPWDLDATFQTAENYLAPMGPEASIFHEFDHFEGDHPNDEEGTQRPLVRRMMSHAEFRNAYVERYRQLLDSTLEESYLRDRIQTLDELLKPFANDTERQHLADATADMLQFVERRQRSVRSELDTL